MSLPPAVTIARVPGKVMLTGEYAVLAGAEALAVTVDRYLQVALSPAPGLGGCRVHSDLWPQAGLVMVGEPSERFSDEPLLAAVAHAMQLYQLSDLDIEVSSQLTVSYGIGSSSALRLAVLLAFREHAEAAAGASRQRPTAVSDWSCAREAFSLQRQAQPEASGYDLATQWRGGLCRFRAGASLTAWPEAVEQAPEASFKSLPELIEVFVGGSGAPTAAVMTTTLSWLADHPDRRQLVTLSEQLRLSLLAALDHPDEPQLVSQLIKACAEHRGFFTSSPVFPTGLASDLEAQPGCDQSWSFKTTGAGGEDALLLVGPRHALARARAVLVDRGWQRLDAAFTRHGATVESRRGAHA